MKKSLNVDAVKKFNESVIVQFLSEDLDFKLMDFPLTLDNALLMIEHQLKKTLLI